MELTMPIEQVQIRVLPDGRVNRNDAAAFLGRSPNTLADWSRLGLGPVPRQVGGRIFYYMRDLEAFRDTGARQAA
jgi:hypothetical protein